MNMPSEDIKDMLIAESASFYDFGETLFIGLEPTKPDDCVTLFDTIGSGPMLTLDRQTNFEAPAVQVRVRNISYVAGWEIINDVVGLLHGRAMETWSGALYEFIKCTTNPAFMAWDENQRAIFVANFDIRRREI